MLYAHPQLLANLDNIDGLREALQSAIELEHATIPPYLTALYSLKPGGSVEITDRIEEVMIEEMFHMTIAANILIAIGGSPQIAHASFLPNYPTSLPGTIANGNPVPIRSFSIDLVKDVFMEIEEPDNPLVFPFKAKIGMGDGISTPKTIGEFYRALQDALIAMGDTIFDPATAARQVNRGIAKPVATAQQAKEAIDKIIEQGEGTSSSPLDTTGNVADNFAHYYSFAEIYHGKKLIPDAQTQFAYAGDPIPFNEDTDVWRMADTPKTEFYRDLGLASAVEASDEFNKAYTSLLKLLHETFNGTPSRLSAAVSVMRDLPDLAAALFQIPLGNGLQAGPTFEWLE